MIFKSYLPIIYEQFFKCGRLQCFRSILPQSSVIRVSSWKDIKVHNNKFPLMFSLQSLLFALLLVSALADCPLSNYPKRTAIGFIDAQFDNDHQLHNSYQNYQYPLQAEFTDGNIDVALGIIGFGVNPNSQINFVIEHTVSNDVDLLKFRVKVKNSEDGWVSIRFNFIASKSFLFQMETIQVKSFSVGLQEGNYGVYRPIPSLSQFSGDTTIKVFLNGLEGSGGEVDEQYKKILNQYKNFKNFSRNKNLVKYFGEALVDNKGLKFKIQDVQLNNGLLYFSIQTNINLKSMSFSYILFSKQAYSQKHVLDTADFSLSYGTPYEFTGLRFMDMTLVGLNGFSLPRDEQYEFALSLDSYLGRNQFNVLTNFEFLQLKFTYISFQLKQEFVCSDCDGSHLIYQQFCVSECPRSYSQVTRLNKTYCERCSIEDLKVVDPDTHECVCARRHYLDYRRDVCVGCPYHCMTCSSPNRCDTCDNNFKQTRRKINAEGRCDCPAVGYYDDEQRQDIVCKACHVSCRTCYGPKAHDCLSCDYDKELDSFGHCVCQNNYEQLEDGSCLCQPPLKLKRGQCINESKVCSENSHQQYFFGIRQCVCNYGYIQVLDKCIKCGENSTFDEENLQCKCVNETVFVDGRCVPCIGNQVYSHDLNKCVCRKKTFETESGECVECPPKMVYRKGKCDCIYNYYKNRFGNCEKCVRDTDGPKCRRIVL